MNKGEAIGVFITTAIACMVVAAFDSIYDVDMGHLVVAAVLFGILFMLGMIYEELKS